MFSMEIARAHGLPLSFGNTHIDTDMYERVFGDESVMNHANCGHKIH